MESTFLHECLLGAGVMAMRILHQTFKGCDLATTDAMAPSRLISSAAEVAII